MRKLVTICLCWAALTGVASAQELPKQDLPKNVRLVVTFPAGGTADVLARLVADQMGAGGQSTFVDNRPGANSIIGNEYAARAPTDGGTLLMVANSFLITSFVRQLPYDPLTSFVPVCSLVDSPLVIVVDARSPYRSLKDFLEAAKQKPGTVTTGAIGPATAQRVAVEMIRQKAGVDINFVPYPTNALALNALLGGEIASATVNIADAAGMAADHRVRFLATLAPQRVAAWADVPTAREGGLDIGYSAWFGLVAPARTPPALMAKLETAVGKALAAPALQAKLSPLEFYPTGQCGAPFADYLRGESEATGRIVRAAGIKME